MGIKVTIEGKKPPVYEIEGATLEDFQSNLEFLGIKFDLLMAESDAVLRFQEPASSPKGNGSGSKSGGNLRTPPTVPVGDDSDGNRQPVPPPASAEIDEEGEVGDGASGPKCAECGSMMDLSPKNAKRIYGRDDICSDCGDAMQ